MALHWQSGRPDSNRRRPAWEAGILPLNYARGITATSLTRSSWLSRPVVPMVVPNSPARKAPNREGRQASEPHRPRGLVWPRHGDLGHVLRTGEELGKLRALVAGEFPPRHDDGQVLGELAHRP